MTAKAASKLPVRVKSQFDYAGSLPATLTKPEENELAECEKIIERGWESFIEVGQALTRIRDKHLYRNTHKSFEDYCRLKWQYGKAHAYRLIGAAQVVEHLKSIDGIPQPLNESQVRPLVGLTGDQAETAWKKAVEQADDKPITANLVRKAAAEFRKKSPSRNGATNAKREGSTARVKAVVELIEEAQSLVKELDGAEKVAALLSRLKKKIAAFAK